MKKAELFSGNIYANKTYIEDANGNNLFFPMTMIIFIAEKTTRNESIGNIEISVCNNNRKTTMEIEHYIYSKMSHHRSNITQF